MATRALTQNLREMADRASDLRRVGDDVHAELLDWQRAVQIGEERNLGPSLQNPNDPDHIWDVRPKTFVFGTSVPYSQAHAKWRMLNGMRSHMDVPRIILKRIAKKVGTYILTGAAR